MENNINRISSPDPRETRIANYIHELEQVSLTDQEKESLVKIYKNINAFFQSEEKHYYGQQIDLSQSNMIHTLQEAGINPSSEMRIDALESIVTPKSEQESSNSFTAYEKTLAELEQEDPSGKILQKLQKVLSYEDWQSFLFSLMDDMNEGYFGGWEEQSTALRTLLVEN